MMTTYQQFLTDIFIWLGIVAIVLIVIFTKHLWDKKKVRERLKRMKSRHSQNGILHDKN